MTKYPDCYVPKLFFESVYQTKKEIREDMDLRKGMKVLDYGCGLGYFLFELSHYPIFGVGVDIDSKCIETVNKIKEDNRITNLEFERLEDDYHVPYPSNYFDFIMCSHVLEHVVNPEAIIKEICRLLSRNGLLIIGVPYKYEKRLVLFKRTYSILKEHVVVGFTQNEIEDMLRRKFEVERVWYTGTTFFTRFLFDMCRFVGGLVKIDKKSSLDQKLNYSLTYRILYLFVSFFSNLLMFEKYSSRKGYTIVTTARRKGL